MSTSFGEQTGHVGPGATGTASWQAWLWLAIPLLVVVVFVVFPIAWTIALSFGEHSISGGMRVSLVGLENYRYFFSSPQLKAAITQSLIVALNPFALIAAGATVVGLACFITRTGSSPLAWEVDVAARLVSIMPMLWASSVVVIIMSLIINRHGGGYYGEMTRVLSMLATDTQFALAVAVPIGTAVVAAFIRGLDADANLSAGRRSARTVRFALALFLVVVALLMQSFATSFFMARPGGAFGRDLLAVMFEMGFIQFRLGVGAVGAVILILVTAALGVCAWLLVRRSGIAVHFDPPGSPKPTPSRFDWAAVIALVAIAVVLVLGLLVYPAIFAADLTAAVETIGETGSYGREFTYLAIAIALHLILGAAGGFALGRYRFTGRQAVIGVIAATALIMPQLVVLGWFVILRSQVSLNMFPISTLLPTMNVGPSILLFAVFFNGLREPIDRLGELRNQNQDGGDEARTLRKMVVVGTVAAVGSVTIVVNLMLANRLGVQMSLMQERMPTLDIIQGMMASGPAYAAFSNTWTALLVPLLPAIVIMVALSVTVLPRMRITMGEQ